MPQLVPKIKWRTKSFRSLRKRILTKPSTDPIRCYCLSPAELFLRRSLGSSRRFADTHTQTAPMPVDYRLRNLRRLFGASNFLRATQPEGNSAAKSAARGSARGATAASSADEGKDETSAKRERRTKASGGVPRAFFSDQPPRPIRNKAAGGQLFTVHLFEKQKMKLYYGAMGDDRFKRYVEEAKSRRRNTDAELLRLLELRLDTFLYRTGFIQTPPQGRQWIHHGKVLVNGRRMTIKSSRLRPGDVVSIRDHHMENALKSAREVADLRSKFGVGASWILSSPNPAGMLPWMEIDRVGLSAVLVREPTDEEARSMTRAALFPYIRDANLNPHAAMRAYR